MKKTLQNLFNGSISSLKKEPQQAPVKTAGVKDAKEIGRKEGSKNVYLKIVKKMVSMGKTNEEIKEITDMTLEEIQKMRVFIENPQMNNVEALLRYVTNNTNLCLDSLNYDYVCPEIPDVVFPMCAVDEDKNVYIINVKFEDAVQSSIKEMMQLYLSNNKYKKVMYVILTDKNAFDCKNQILTFSGLFEIKHGQKIHTDCSLTLINTEDKTIKDVYELAESILVDYRPKEEVAEEEIKENVKENAKEETKKEIKEEIKKDVKTAEKPVQKPARKPVPKKPEKQISNEEEKNENNGEKKVRKVRKKKVVSTPKPVEVLTDDDVEIIEKTVKQLLDPIEEKTPKNDIID